MPGPPAPLETAFASGRPRAVLGLLLVLCLGLSAQQRIADVEFRGLGPSDSPPRGLSSFPGAVLDPRGIEQDLARLHALGRYADSLAVSVRETPEGPVVVFDLRPLPRLVATAEAPGLTAFSAEALLDLLPRGAAAHPARVHAVAESLRIGLERRGYWWHTVTPRSETRPEGVALRFEVSEGPQVSLGELRFEGNFALRSESLRVALEPYQVRRLDRDAFQQLARVLRATYLDRGYLLAEVWVHEVEEVWSAGEVHVTFGIDEGERFTLAALELPPDIDPGAVVVGAPVDLPALRRLRFRVQLHYEDRGHFDAELRERIALVGPREAAVEIRAEPGPAYRVGRIDLYGNEKTRDTVILDRLALRPGAYPTPGWRARSLLRLRRPDLFDDLRIGFRDGLLPGTKDVIVDVDEAFTWGAYFSASFNEGLGPLADLVIEERNFDLLRWPKSFADLIAGRGFSGGAQRLALSVGAGRDRLRGRIRYASPNVFSPDLNFYLSADAETQRLEAHRETVYAVEPELRRLLMPGMWAGLSLRLAQVQIEDIRNIDAFEILLDSGDHQVGSVGLRWVWDRRRRQALTWTGTHLEAGLKLQAGFNGGDSDLVEGNLRFDFGFGLPGDLVLETRLAAGWIEPLDGERVTVFDRYYLGGRRLLRGFRYRGAGPRQAGEPIGGRARAISSLDLSFPLFWERLRGNLFIDAGLLAESWEEAELEDIRVGAGGGFRFLVPALDFPIRVDLAWPLVKNNEDADELFSFSLQLFY